MFPRIHLAIDNCFGSKRWTEPIEWMEVIRDLGLQYIEASADNECDPLYMGPDYMADWIKAVKAAEQKTGMKVVNMYSGHGTYATLGLTHTDGRIRRRFLDQWLKPMVANAGRVDAGLGFFCHAFSEAVLQDINRYKEAKEGLYQNLAELSGYAENVMQHSIGVEQMYTPHQVPWTIEGATELLSSVYGNSGYPFYITIDVGHQSGQRKFLFPTMGLIKEKIRSYRNGERIKGLWLGPREAFELFFKAAQGSKSDENNRIKELLHYAAEYGYLFASYIDGDPYAWIEALGGYSPIIHLQQTDGTSSSHWPFTRQMNDRGIIDGKMILNTLYTSYQSEPPEGCPPRVEDIYLTLEMFSSTADITIDIIGRLQETVTYWRQFVPEDGLRLDELVPSI